MRPPIEFVTPSRAASSTIRPLNRPNSGAIRERAQYTQSPYNTTLVRSASASATSGRDRNGAGLEMPRRQTHGSLQQRQQMSGGALLRPGSARQLRSTTDVGRPWASGEDRLPTSRSASSLAPKPLQLPEDATQMQFTRLSIRSPDEQSTPQWKLRPGSAGGPERPNLRWNDGNVGRPSSAVQLRSADKVLDDLNLNWLCRPTTATLMGSGLMMKKKGQEWDIASSTQRWIFCLRRDTSPGKKHRPRPRSAAAHGSPSRASPSRCVSPTRPARRDQEINYANGLWKWQTSLRTKGQHQSAGPYSHYVMLEKDARKFPGAYTESVHQLMCTTARVVNGGTGAATARSSSGHGQ